MYLQAMKEKAAPVWHWQMGIRKISISVEFICLGQKSSKTA